VGQDAAFEEGVELAFDELRKVGAGGIFSLSEEGRGGAHSGPGRHPAPARAAGECLAREAPEVVASAISSRALPLNRPVCRLPVCAHRGWDTFEGLDALLPAASGRRVHASVGRCWVATCQRVA
jgi:hypothetical protein